MSDIDAVAVDSLKALDPEWPIREADIPLGAISKGGRGSPPRTSVQKMICVRW